MPVFRLSSQILFPPPHFADESGLLAIGGDLSAERLLAAYGAGIFPWYNPGEPILWWSPPSRCILLHGDFHLSRSVRKEIKLCRYSVTIDHAFSQVIRACACSGIRKEEGTWLGEEMIAAYEELYIQGFCHSFEVWEGEELVGGLYGVHLGRCFFGESMFHSKTDCSKIALFALNQTLFAAGFVMIDMQMPTPHLLSLGGRIIERQSFGKKLREGLTGEVQFPLQVIK